MLQGINGFAILLCGALLLSALDADAARYYRSVDEQGNVTFSDRPDGAAVEQLDVKVFTPEPVAAPSASPKTATEKPAVTAEDEETAQQDVKMLQEKRKKNCTIAKERLQKLQNVSRLYSEDEKGNRTYISDDERLLQLTTARENITEWCQK